MRFRLNKCTAFLIMTALPLIFAPRVLAKSPDDDIDHKPVGLYFTRMDGNTLYPCTGTVAVDAIDISTGFDPDKANNGPSEWYNLYSEEYIYIEKVHQNSEGIDDWYLIRGEAPTYLMVAAGKMTQEQANQQTVGVHFRAWIRRWNFDRFFDSRHCPL